MLRNAVSGRMGATEARPSPNKYNTQQNNNSISQQKYKNETTITMRNNSVSPQKSSAVQQHNLSSLILMPSPIKFAPQNTNIASNPQQSDISQLDRTNPQFVALHLTSNVFLNSTTRFMKGFNGSPKGSPANSKDKNTHKQSQITKKMQYKGGASSIRNQKTPQKNALQMTASKYMQSTTKYVKPSEEQSLVYPSKQKIQKIIKGQLSTARSSQKRISGGIQQSTINRNRFKSQISENKGNASSASRSHSNSSSVRRLSRRKEKQRELKFMEKKRDTEQGIASQTRQKGAQIQIKISNPPSKVEKSAPIQRQGLHNVKSAQIINRNMQSPKIQQNNIASPKPISRNQNKITEVKSAEPRPTAIKQQVSKPFSRQPQNNRQPLIKPLEQHKQEKKQNENPKQKTAIPSIIQPNMDSKIQKKQQYRSLKTLPSGELPLQTPIKPARMQSSKLIQDTKEQSSNFKPIQRGKAVQPPQISSIKQENSSEMNNNSKNMISKKTSYYGYSKQQASTHIDVQPTQPLVYQGAQSKLSKNQSTKIVPPNEPFQRIWGGSTLTKIINNHNNKPNKIEEKVEENNTALEPKKAITRKQEKVPAKQSISQTKISLSPSIIIEDNQKKTFSRNQISYQNKKQKEPIEISSQTSLQQTVSAKKNNNVRSPEATRTSARQMTSPASKDQQKGVLQAQSSKIIPNVTTSAGNLTTKTSQQSLVQRISPSAKAQVVKKEDNVANQQNSAKIISKRQSLKEEGNKQVQFNQTKKQDIGQRQGQINVISNIKRIVGPLLQTIYKRYRKNIAQGFDFIRNFSKHIKSHQQQASILCQAAVNIHRNLAKNNYRSVFQQLKRVSLSNQNNKKQSLTSTAGRQFASAIVFRILSSKQRSFFDSIKMFSFLQKQIPNIVNKQTKDCNKDITALQTVILSQFMRIMTSYHQSKAKLAFSKIVLESISKIKQRKPIANQQTNQIAPNARSPQKIVKPPRDYQSQKRVLYQNRDGLTEDLSRLQNRISDKKKYTTIEKSKLLKKQDDLNKKNQILQKEVLQKRNKNKDLKNTVQQSQPSQDLDISLPEFEPLVGILTQIYSTVFKSMDDIVDAEKLVKKYKLSREDHSPILDEWAAQAENLRLKREIGRWQGEQQIHRSKVILLKQQEIASKVLKNYVRQRYLWQWVKIAAQKL